MARQLRHLELQAWEPKSAGTLQEELNSTCCEIQLVEKEFNKNTAHDFQVSNCSGKTLQLSENVFLIPLNDLVASSRSSSRDALCVCVCELAWIYHPISGPYSYRHSGLQYLAWCEKSRMLARPNWPLCLRLFPTSRSARRKVPRMTCRWNNQ